MPILFDNKNVADIFIDARAVSQVYVDTNLVWQKPSGGFFIWDNGAQNGYSWRKTQHDGSIGVGHDTTSAAAKLVPIAAYQWYMNCEAGYADGQGFSTLRVYTTSSSSTNTWQRAEIQTTTAIPIAAEHKYLNITVRRLGGTQQENELYFGLFKSGADRYDVPNGNGVVNADAISLTSTTFATYSIRIPAEMVGNAYHFNLYHGIYKPTVSGQGLSCKQVWLSATKPSGATLLAATTTE